MMSSFPSNFDHTVFKYKVKIPDADKYLGDGRWVMTVATDACEEIFGPVILRKKEPHATIITQNKNKVWDWFKDTIYFKNEEDAIIFKLTWGMD